MKKEYLYGLAGAVIGGLLVWFLTMTTVNSGSANMMGMMGFRTNRQAVMQNSNSIDAHFIEQMIPHHEDAITMSEIALVRATRPEVKELAENIIDAQTKEINEMKAWYKNWFGKEVPKNTVVMGQHGMMGSTGSPQVGRGQMHMGLMGTEADLESLENAEDFDREYVSEMIPHHQMAVMMANMLKNSTQRSEMKTLANNIISSQTAEIDQMRDWLTQWE